jgi:hypothetical protein
MEDTKFRLLFRGDISPGSDLNEVKNRLVLLLKADISKIETLFSGKTIVLKNNLSENEAARFKKAFDKTGGISILEPVPGQETIAVGKNGQSRHECHDKESHEAKNAFLANINREPEKPASGERSGLREPSAARPITLKQQQITCPKCGEVQEKNDSCISCGIIYAKYKHDLEREISGYSPHKRQNETDRQSVNELCEIAAAQKLLIWAVAAGFAVFLSPYLYILVVPFKLYAVYRISRVLRFEMVFRIICMVCMFVPLLGIIILLVLNSKATGTLSSAGVRVGLSGASQADLDAMGAGGKGSSFLAPAFVAVLLAIAIAGLSTGMLPSSLSGTQIFSGNSLEREIAKANKQFPKQIDSETRIDSVAVGPGKLIIYNYTLVNYSADDVDSDKFQEALAARVRQETCRNRETRPYIRKGYSIAYSYNGKNGNPVATMTVAPEDCGGI